MSYSEPEIRLIKYFGFDEVRKHIAPMPLYRLMVQSAFIRGQEDEPTKALRRGFTALIKSEVDRLTKEFDALIEF